MSAIQCSFFLGVNLYDFISESRTFNFPNDPILGVSPCDRPLALSLKQVIAALRSRIWQGSSSAAFDCGYGHQARDVSSQTFKIQKAAMGLLR
jgi:hypothetical protein